MVGAEPGAIMWDSGIAAALPACEAPPCSRGQAWAISIQLKRTAIRLAWSRIR